MATKKDPKAKGVNVGNPQLIASQIMGDPNLMEVEIKYSRVLETLEIKAMIDETLLKNACRIIKKVFDGGLLVFENEELVSLDPVDGSNPAFDLYDSIKLGDV